MIRFAFALLLALVIPLPAMAGPIAAAISAVSAWAASSAVAAFVVRIGTSIALSALSRALAGKPRQPGIKTETTTSGDTVPQSFVLGRYATAGNRMAPPYSWPNSGKRPNVYLTYVVDLADMPGCQFSRLMVNGSYVDDLVANDGQWAASHQLMGNIRDNGPYLWMSVYDGSQTAADAYMMQHFADHPERPWSADMVGTGLSYAVVTFYYNREIYNGLPGLRFELLGLPLYDPRHDDTVGGSGAQRWDDPATWVFTENPVVMIYNILRGITLPDGARWGGSVEAEDLPLANWFAAMNECDVPVALAEGGTEPQYRAGLEVGVDEEPADIIDELLKACSGEIVEFGGVFKVRVGPPAMPVYFFTDDDVVASQPQNMTPHPGLEGVSNAIHAVYPEPATVWEVKDAPSRYNPAWEAEDGGRRLVADISYPAVPYGTQVQRLVASTVADGRRFRGHSLTLPPDAAVLEPLDTAAWTSERHGYDAEVFEIGELADDMQTVLQSVAMRARDASDFAWTVADEVVVSHPSPAPIELEPREVDALAATSVTISDASGKPRLAAITLSWDGDEVGDARGLEYELRVAGETDLASRGSVADPEAGTVVFSQGVIPGADMEVRAKLLVSRQAVWSDWVPVTVTGTRLSVDAPFVMSNTTRRDEIGVMHVDWEVRLSCQTGDADLFELQRKVSETEWETVGVSETGAFSLLDIYVVNFRARCRNLFGVWGDWTPEQGGVVLPQAPTPQNFAFDQLEALGLMWAKANLKVDGDATITGQSYYYGRANFRLASIHEDNVPAWFGSGFDMKIRHDGYNGEIRVQPGMGQLLLRAPSILAQIDDGSGGLWSGFSVGAGGAFNANYQGALKFYTTSYGGVFNGRLLLQSGAAGEDSTRLVLNRNEAGAGDAWVGIPPWNPDGFYIYGPNGSGGAEDAARYHNREWRFRANGATILNLFSDRIVAEAPIKLPDYTVASAPLAAAFGDGAQIWITDAAGGPTQANSLSGFWVRVRDNVAVT